MTMSLPNSTAVMFLLEHGGYREKYNIAGSEEISNLDVARTVANVLGKDLHYRCVNPVDVRPGFDVRYGLSGKKMAAMGWRPAHTFENNIEYLVQWMVRPENAHWLVSNREGDAQWLL